MNTSTVRNLCEEFNCDVATVRKLLGLLYMHHEREHIFEEENALDSIVQRIVNGIFERVRSRDEGILEAVERASVMVDAWKQRDRETTIIFLQQECLIRARRGQEPDPQSLMHLGQIAGPESVENIRARCQRILRGEHRQETVEQVAMRAFRDVHTERIRSGDFSCLFDILRDMQRGILAIMTAAPRSATMFSERFDVDFLKEKHRNGVLTLEEMRNYAKYVARHVESMSAPADARGVREWFDGFAQSTSELQSPVQYAERLVDFVTGIGGHVRQIVSRLEALRTERS